jgi:YfiH family protein
MEAGSIYMLKQVHGRDVASVDVDTNLELEIDADASVTTRSGVILGIQTADCVPVLFSCDKGEVIGAAHCGWRSAKSDLVREVAGKMRSQGARHIKAVIGPSIQQFSYEVDGQYYQDFMNETKANEAYFIPSIKNGHYMFDLPAYVKQKLMNENIEIIAHINEDTYSMEDKYPSYRRDFHAGRKYSQNILSVIVKK